MSLGSLLLVGDNYELWVALACLSGHKALKHCAFSRGLQFDVSLVVAWACLGKLYRELGDKQLARQEFDRARSIDPSLALPWAGMSADVPTRSVLTDISINLARVLSKVLGNALDAVRELEDLKREDNYINLKGEYMRCLNLQTYYPVGWMCLKFIESQYDLLDEVNSFYEGFRGCVNGSEGSQNMWMAVYNLLLGLISAWAQDLVHAEELTGKACSLVAWLVQRAASSHATKEAWVLRRSGRRTFIWKALLGHQMEASTLEPTTLCHRCVDYLGVRAWSDVQSTNGSQPSSGIDGNEILQRWILKAIHLNPNCSRYWKTLLNYVDWAAEM
ncbi:hypothetical protein Ancab_037390 [Ancistrocladus abbreviatus]